ncbi:unnamed protein product, partial [Leptidea sinapis]
KYFN